MKDFIAAGWKDIFAHNGLTGFDSWWQLNTDWFEPPNKRRGGWSGVARVELDLPQGGHRRVFLKRQENHVRKTWRHPLRGEATFIGEMRNLQDLAGKEVGTLEPLYFAQRRQDGNVRVVLLTLELTGYIPLKEIIDQWQGSGWQQHRLQRLVLIPRVAQLVSRMHHGYRVHNSLYPKHLFVNTDSMDVRVIDLEKMRRALTPLRAAKRDLDSLNRRSPHFSRTDRLRFLLAYLGEGRVTPQTRGLWRYLAKRWRPVNK